MIGIINTIGYSHNEPNVSDKKNFLSSADDANLVAEMNVEY